MPSAMLSAITQYVVFLVSSLALQRDSVASGKWKSQESEMVL